MNTDFDIAVLGGGLAGLSLLYHLIEAGKLADKKVLLVDPAGRKNKYDRTWSFWEAEPGPFESLVHHRWDTVTVHDNERDLICELAPYQYKLIRSSDFYAHVNKVIDAAGVVTRLTDRAENITSAEEFVHFTSGGQSYRVTHAYSSLPLHLRPRQIKQPYLDQHFKGWIIKTEEPVFDPAVAALMDFRTPQHDETRFLYVLPTSSTEALVEVAIFSNNHLTSEAYDEILSQYIAAHWTEGAYTVKHVEQGNIPMTTYPFPTSEGNLTYIGLRGGAARPSTGYTFYGMQRQLGALAKSFPSRAPKPWRRRDLYYDATILGLLQHNRLRGDQIFLDLFSANPTPRLLAFLNGESDFTEELAIMSTTNIREFGKSFVLEALR
ncbi:lycopene cyclase family protein [Lewinella sp. 4G2]|uniref:lycopene cyclase family protein n=1 Tax=Lewinella sp. 4G2 TaxID=1803372 RepID=UPI0007B4D031|nr:lycopene cyclase family protein [Lewinella sp. 4G2]OAV42981.1 hypothetical protein A3850_000010 [Lewinella sp. 4G2]